MTAVAINPGTGPVTRATFRNAERALKQLLHDAGVVYCQIRKPRLKNGRRRQADERGYYLFHVTTNARTARVHVPGLPLGRVRFIRDRGMNAWDFQRLYVDGSSWLWCYAIIFLRDALRIKAPKPTEER